MNLNKNGFNIEEIGLVHQIYSTVVIMEWRGAVRGADLTADLRSGRF